MFKRLLLTGLTALAFCAEAGPLTFFDVQFDATAIALSDGPPEANVRVSPPDATPVSASAASVGALDVATAGAFAAPGLLLASADATSGGGVANAVGTAHFLGSFLNVRPVTFNIDFFGSDFAVDTGSATTSLFVLLTSGGSTLFAEFVTGLWEFAYSPVDVGGTSTLQLTLSSEAGAGFPTAGFGGGAGIGVVAFAATVPTPATGLLVMLGLGALVVVRPRAQRS